MPAAGVVMIVAVVLIVAALVVYLVSTIVALAADQHRASTRRSPASTGSSRRARRSATSSRRSTRTSTPASTCSRACSSRRPGSRTPSASSTGSTRAPPPRGFRNFPDSTTRHGAADLRGLHEGNADARAARARGADRGRQPRTGRRCATRPTAAPPRARCIPDGRPEPGCPDADAALAGDRAPDSPRARYPERTQTVQTPAPFEYERATSVDGAIASLKRLGPEARIIAGGHSLLPMMKLRLANPEHLIDINDLDELSYIREEGGEIGIGALTRHVELLESELLAEHFPLFRDAEQVIADPVVRNRGTIGGSLCQADAAEDLSAVCSALKASAVIRGPDGERVVGDGRVPHRPVHDRRRGRRDADRGPAAAAAGRRQRPREGRAPRRRLGDRRRLGRGLDRRRHDRRRRRRAQRGRPDDDPPHPRRGAAARQARRRRSCSRRRARSPRRTARRSPDGRGPVDYKRHLAGVLTKRALRRASARALHQEA